MKYQYLLDERDTTQSSNHPLFPLRVFNLETFGVNPDNFLRAIRPTFSMLHLDPYDAKRAKVEFLKARFPAEHDRLTTFIVGYYADTADLRELFDLIVQLSDTERFEFDRLGMMGRRKRSVARFILRRVQDASWAMERVPAERYQQKVAPNDPRAIVRIFHETDPVVAKNPDVQAIMSGLADMVLELRPGATMLQINLHQMFIFTDLSLPGDNSPEGIHQDGADFIVSALVIERAGIIGGESIVYGPDKKTEYLRRTLQPGEGIFQADKDALWHYVTPIREDPTVPPDYGHRSILGFDIDVLG